MEKQTKQEDEGFTYVNDNIREINERAFPKVDICYSIKKKAKAALQVKVEWKLDSSINKIIYTIEIKNKEGIKHKLEKRFNEIESLKKALEDYYGTATDIGIAGEIENTEKSFMAYHVLPFLDKCETATEGTKEKIGLQAMNSQKIKQRRFKIELFILKILNNSILAKSKPWRDFISKSKEQKAESTAARVMNAAYSFKDFAMKTFSESLEKSKEKDSLQVTFLNLKNFSEQLDSHKQIFTVCQELVGSNEPTYRECLEDLNNLAWYAEDLYEQVSSIIKVKEMIMALEVVVEKGKKDDIDIINTKIYLANTKHFFELEKQLIEAAISEDLQFIIDEFKRVVHAMTNIKQT